MAGHNCGESPVAGVVMSSVQSKKLLADLVMKLSMGTVCYWWRLMGDEANSLCKLLDTSWNDLRLMLRKCGILYGPADSFKTSEFEKWRDLIGCHYTIYRPKGKPVYFLKFGQKEEDAFAVEKPKGMYSLGGVLERVPIVGIHLPGIRTKISRRLAASLVNAVADDDCGDRSDSKTTPDDNNNDNNKRSMSTYITKLIDVVKQEIMFASQQGSKCAYTQRSERVLRRAAVVAVKASLSDVIEAWVDRIGEEKEVEECISTPAASDTGTISTGELSRRLI